MTTLIIIGVIVILIIAAVSSGNKQTENLDDSETTDYSDYSEEMAPAQAERIVNQYGSAVAQGTEGIARPISLLTHSKEEVKQAFKNYIIYLRDSNQLTDELDWLLRSSYSAIDRFVENDKADIINRVHHQLANEETTDPDDQAIYLEFVNSFTSTTDRYFELDRLIE